MAKQTTVNPVLAQIQAAAKANQQYAQANAQDDVQYDIVMSVEEYIDALGADTMSVNKAKSGLNFFGADGGYIASLSFTRNLRQVIATSSMSVADLLGLQVQRITTDVDGNDVEPYFMASAPQANRISVKDAKAAAARKVTAVTLDAADAAIVF